MIPVLTLCDLATSTAVERVFSQGRQVLHFTRNGLSSQSLREFLCLGSWSRHNMVLISDLLHAVRSNMKLKAPVSDPEDDAAGEGKVSDVNSEK